ncbi:MAG: pseudaminic acid cytidylyltransferase [Ignavibacteriales bacterium]|nr:pseudaminic acid cytidylyltransferase [Ignavibacteriales bacterium]
MNKSRKIAIIPARGGSKRIPRKNIKDFLGKPIIAYSIEAAFASDLFDEVMVSTDDPEIAEVARKYGAKVPFIRSKKNSSDFATTADVLIEVLGEYKKIGEEFDYLCCIYSTAPFITAEKLKNSFNLMFEKDADAVIPVVKFSYPIQRALRISKNYHLEYLWPENINKRSQDLEETYHDSGQFYWIKSRKIFQSRQLLQKKTIPFIVSEMEVQDIDNIDDWQIAILKFNSIFNL